MNDDEFARQVFARALDGEPSVTPDLEHITTQCRKAMRARHGIYAAGGAALAGIVTAGVVSGPTLLGLGSSPPGMSTAGQGTGTERASGTTPSTKTSPDLSNGKAQVATPCATSPQIDWTQIISQNVPGAHPRLTPKADVPTGPGCVMLPDGSMDIEVLLTIANPNGVVQIDVDTGGSKQGRPSASATPNADLQAKMDALKAQQATGQSTGDATNSPPAAAAPSKAEGLPTCSTVAPGEQVCVAHVEKGGYVGVSAALSRTTPKPLFVQVIGSSGAPTGPSGTPPLSPAQVSAIAQAVAGHF